MDISSAKKHLRKICKSQRDQLSCAQRDLYSDQVMAFLEAFIQAENFDQVFGYRSFGSELSVNSLIDKLSLHRCCALPRIDGKLGSFQMSFHRYQAGDLLLKNAYGIEEPQASQPILEPAHNMKTLMILPSLALSQNGKRLGYGGGFYDRYIDKNSEIIRVGINFSMLCAMEVPTGAHDAIMDYICSENGLRKTRV